MKKLASILIFVLALLFWKSFLPSQILFSNDGSLGTQVAAQVKTPGLFISVWQDLNWLGGREAPVSIGPSGGFRTVCFYWPLTLCVLCFVFCVYSILHYKISFRHLVGYSCFLFAGLIILCMIIGLDNEFAQAIISVGCLFFMFVIIFIFSTEPVSHANEARDK